MIPNHFSKKLFINERNRLEDMSETSTAAHPLNITIIIPAYNEENRISACLERLKTFCRDKEWNYEIVVVEDSSNDKTATIVDSYHRVNERITLMSLPTRLGKGGSIACAALRSTTEYTAYMDVDLAADVTQLEHMLKSMDNHDIVIGSRILRGNLPPIKRPLYRSVLSSLYSRAFAALFRIPIYDPQCGIKIFKTSVLSKLLKNMMVSGFAFDTDLIVAAHSMSMSIQEIPVEWIHRESSKVEVFSEIKTMGLDLLSIWYNYHLRWKNGDSCYPQKKGSIFGKCLFALLTQIKSVRTRHEKYMYNDILDLVSVPATEKKSLATLNH